MHRHEDIYLLLSAEHRMPLGSRAGPPHRARRGRDRRGEQSRVPGAAAGRAVDVPDFSGEVTVLDLRSSAVERRRET